MDRATFGVVVLRICSRNALLVAVFSSCVAPWPAWAAEIPWCPVEGRIMTRWANDVSPENVLPEYPRPMMVRSQWLNLNGLWKFAIRPREAARPQQFDGDILVPFPVESALSGVKKSVGEANRIWYRRNVQIPASWKGRRVLLHFDAVDWEATVWVNDKEIGIHRGGYDPFIFDVTEALNETATNEILLAVWDPTDSGYQPRGKQVNEPERIWYTSVTGIWQTVWMEPVPPASIKSLKVSPDIDAGVLRLLVEGCGTEKADTVEAIVLDVGQELAAAGGVPGKGFEIPIKDAKLWSPDSPFLYDLRVSLMRDGNVIDEVSSYFGMRKISLDKDTDGVTRIFLNNEALFQYGPLDQGWWPDGLYRAPTDEALRYDLEVLKKLGCNMLRKHVKVEPRRLYYWCDKLGLLVWQDMPNGDRHVGREEPDIVRTPESARQFELELKRVIDALHNHPSVVMWVPFNEGWGQYDTARIVRWIKECDPTRLVNNASGWADRGVGDIHDVHKYPGPAAPPNESDRAAVLGEFGGLGLPVEGHTWQDKENWGYRSYTTAEELTTAYLDLLKKLKPLIDGGLSAAVYTQTTDVEIEVNGLMTYDRARIKMSVDEVTEANRALRK